MRECAGEKKTGRRILYIEWKVIIGEERGREGRMEGWVQWVKGSRRSKERSGRKQGVKEEKSKREREWGKKEVGKREVEERREERGMMEKREGRGKEVEGIGEQSGPRKEVGDRREGDYMRKQEGKEG